MQEVKATSGSVALGECDVGSNVMYVSQPRNKTDKGIVQFWHVNSTADIAKENLVVYVIAKRNGG